MEIISKRGQLPSFPESLRPLFDHMKSGNMVHSVRLMKGSNGFEDLDTDIFIWDFKAETYWPELGGNKIDYVDVSPVDPIYKKGFYMSHVRDFCLTKDSQVVLVTEHWPVLSGE